MQMNHTCPLEEIDPFDPGDRKVLNAQTNVFIGIGLDSGFDGWFETFFSKKDPHLVSFPSVTVLKTQFIRPLYPLLQTPDVILTLLWAVSYDVSYHSMIQSIKNDFYLRSYTNNHSTPSISLPRVLEFETARIVLGLYKTYWTCYSAYFVTRSTVPYGVLPAVLRRRCRK